MKKILRFIIAATVTAMFMATIASAAYERRAALCAIEQCVNWAADGKLLPRSIALYLVQT